MSFIDPRDNRTSPFNSAEFGNAWAVFRGEVFQTYDLTPFQREWSEWLAERDRQVAAKALEDLAWDGFEAYLVDPELEWENQPSVAAQHFKSSAEKLRRRASEYRKEEEDE